MTAIYNDPWGPPEDDRPHTWRPLDLTAVLNGTHTPPQPTVGARTDGVGMYYPGRMHTLASESEAGKTWMALDSCRHELHNGNGVIYVDFEDDEGGVVGRLLALGASPDAIRDRFAYIRPEEPVNVYDNATDLAQALDDLTPTLAILDGVTEAMTMHGMDPLSNKDAALFGRMVPRAIADRGPAVTALDHVTKSAEARGRYAIGAVHKLNGLNGAAYLLENRTAFGVGLTGKSTILVAKDRPGQIRRHALPSGERRYWYGDLVVRSERETFVTVEITPPTDKVEGWRPTALMTKIAEALVHYGPLSQRKIIVAVGGNRDNAIKALNFLQLDGHVSDQTPHELLKPYPPEGVNT